MHRTHAPARACALFLLALAAACTDAPAPLSPEPPRPEPELPTSALATLTCTGSTRGQAELSCSAAMPSAGGALADVYGVQGVSVRVTGTNVFYDAGAQLFSADVTVQNLLVMRIGTPDGSTVTGVRVFFYEGPVTTVGSGTVTVNNATGQKLFTAPGQPYFQYDESLPAGGVSASRRWELNVPSTVTTFTFKLAIQADLLSAVVFDRQDALGNRDIWRVSVDGNDLVRLTTDTGEDQDPTIAGDKLVWVTYRHGQAELYGRSVFGATETRLTTSSAADLEPALSPDGTKLAFTRDASGVSKLWTANADGTGAAAAYSGFGSGASIDGTPSWLGSTRLAFMSTGLGTASIFDLTLPGTPTLLVDTGSNEVEPEWSPARRVHADSAVSPAGRWVVFASDANPEEDSEIYLKDLVKGTLTRLTTRVGTDSHPSFLHDGRIVFSAWVPTTITIAGNPVQITVQRLRIVDPAAPGVTTDIPIDVTRSSMHPVGVRR